MFGSARPDATPPLILRPSAFSSIEVGVHQRRRPTGADEFARSGVDAPTTRVKMLWTEAKGEASGSSKKKEKKPLPTPLSIQKRESPAVPKPPAPPLVDELHVVVPPLPTQLPLPPLMDPHQELLARIQACETALSTRNGAATGGLILPPSYSAYELVLRRLVVHALCRSTPHALVLLP